MDSYVPGLQAGFENGHMNQARAVLKWFDGGKKGAFPGTSARDAFLYLRQIEMIFRAGIEGRRVMLSDIEGL